MSSDGTASYQEGMPQSPDGNSLSIGVITSKRTSYSVKRLLDVGRSLGHRMRALEPQKFAILLDNESPSLMYRGKPLPPLDAVIPRVSAMTSNFGAAVVQQFEQMGVFVANPSHAILNSRDKFRGTQILTRRGIGLPRTAFVAEPAAVEPALDHLGGAPVVVKLIEGSQGIGVTLAEHRQTAVALVDMLHTANQQCLLQSFVAESRGTDIRVLVIDGEAVAAMRRRAAGDEFRSNLHRGGSATAFDLPENYARSAIRATQTLGLRIAGVDILESNDGPMVIEVNSSPGLEGIEKSTGVDIAGHMIRFVERQCHLPEVDVRQKLTMAHGHSIIEMTVQKGSPLVGAPLGQCGLARDSMQVLTVARKEIVTPLPKASFTFEVGDKLVIFGPSEELRAWVPTLGRKRRRRDSGLDAP